MRNHLIELNKGSWERVCYSSALQNRERGGGEDGNWIAVRRNDWNVKCRNEVGRMLPDTILFSKLRKAPATEAQ